MQVDSGELEKTKKELLGKGFRLVHWMFDNLFSSPNMAKQHAFQHKSLRENSALIARF